MTEITVTTVSSVLTGGCRTRNNRFNKIKCTIRLCLHKVRAVTVDDYKTYTKKLFPNTQSVSVWGGEDGSFDTSTGVSSNPEYGKVFISIKSTTGENLTSEQKSNLVKDLTFKVASVTPVIVDPETTYLILNTTFQYDSTSTTSTKDELASLVNTTISSYNSTDLQDFNNVFRHSKLLRLIDETDSSILNNTTTVTMGKFFTPVIVGESSYNINFNNAFFNPHSGHNADAGGVLHQQDFI